MTASELFSVTELLDLTDHCVPIVYFQCTWAIRPFISMKYSYLSPKKKVLLKQAALEKATNSQYKELQPTEKLQTNQYRGNS